MSRLLRTSTLTGAVLVLVALVFATAAAAQTGPRAVALEPIKDFDVVPKGENVEHAFEIKNEGDAPLQITNVRPACGCTVVRFDQEIAPGEIGKIYSVMDTTDFTGPISKSIAVFTNDAENPKLQLVVKAKVKPFIGVRPGYARYIYVQGEEVRPIPQTIYTADGADFKILEVKAPYDYLEVAHHVASEEERYDKAEGQQHVVDIELATDAPIGALREYVEVKTTHPKQPMIRIPISGFVRPRQHITPHELDFGKLQGESLPLRRTFHFTNFITDPIEISKVESDLEGVTFEVEKSDRQPGHRLKLLVTLGPEVPKGKFETVVKVYITDERNPVVELPIEGEIL